MRKAEFIKRYGIEKYQENLERVRSWNLEHVEERKEYQRKWQDKHNPKKNADKSGVYTVNQEIRDWGFGRAKHLLKFNPWTNDEYSEKHLMKDNEIRKKVYDRLNIPYETKKKADIDADSRMELIKQFEEEWLNLPNDANGEHMDDRQIEIWLYDWKRKLGI